MFTGIVEEVGTIKSINRGQHSAVLTVRAKTVLEGTRIGDSIAVNGICLTVRQLFPDSFAADVMHETLNRSALAQLTVGSAVNLERAMPANGRFGGHIVAGHVDGVGRIANIRKDDTAIWYTIVLLSKTQWTLRYHLYAVSSNFKIILSFCFVRCQDVSFLLWSNCGQPTLTNDHSPLLSYMAQFRFSKIEIALFCLHELFIRRICQPCQ